MASLNIKCSTGTKLTVTAELDKTVGELKAQLQAEVGVPPEQMRLIYAGRVLKDPQTLASYNIADGHTVHLVQGAAAPAASVTSPPSQPGGQTSPPPGISGLAASMAGGGGSMNMQQQMMQDPEMMREMMNSPMMQSLMSNPELMRTIIQSNPQMQAIIEQNPEIGHVLNDPSVLRQTLEVARSPELMREMMRTTDRAMSNIESHPEGFNMLRRMYHNVQEPLMDAASGGRNTSEALQETAAPTPDPDNPFAELFMVGVRVFPCLVLCPVQQQDNDIGARLPMCSFLMCCVCVLWYVVLVVHYSHRRRRRQGGVPHQQLTRGRLLRLLPRVHHHRRQARAQRLWAASVLGAWGV
jgi:hypothetical protein